MGIKSGKKIFLIIGLIIILLWPQAAIFAVTKSKIGDICLDGLDNDDCELGGANLDCEESDKKDGSGNNLKYCTTNSDEDCQNAYSAETPGQWKRSSGADYTYDLAYCYNDSVSPVVVRTAAGVNKNASPIGKLADAVFDSPAARTALLEEVKTFKPGLEIRLPGLTFSDLGKNIDSEGYLHIPWIGEFIKAVYNFGLVIVSIIAVVMIIMQGAKIVVSGGESKVEGYKKIGQVAVGLVIAWGSYAILYTINPALVEFKSLRVKYIQTIALDSAIGKIAKIGVDGNLEVTPITDPNFHHDSLPADNKVTEGDIDKVAQSLNIDACVLSSIILKESGGNLLATGHDEDFAVPGYPNPSGSGGCVPRVISRGNFLTGGVKYSGATFSPITEAYDACKHNAIKVSNDDYDSRSASRNVISKFVPPDYGIDWKYSHGIGLGQVTIFPYGGKFESENTKINGPHGQEWARKIGGRWFTVTDLFNLDKTVEATMLIIKNCAKYAKTDLEGFYKCYAGDEGGIPRGMKFYCSCLAKKSLPAHPLCSKYK